MAKSSSVMSTAGKYHWAVGAVHRWNLREARFYEPSESGFRGELKGARTAGTKDLSKACRGLTESRTGDVAVVAKKVSRVVRVEDLSHKRQAPAVAKLERPAHPH